MANGIIPYCLNVQVNYGQLLSVSFSNMVSRFQQSTRVPLEDDNLTKKIYEAWLAAHHIPESP